MSARPLPIPRLGLGRSATFTFDGGRLRAGPFSSEQQLITPPTRTARSSSARASRAPRCTPSTPTPAR
ncbi:MAG: hypothetical protein R3A52_06175 [Polyangiales bacterium]